MSNDDMKFSVLLPEQIFLKQKIRKLCAEGPDGGFCLLPRHIDFVSSLVPGLLSYVTLEGQEEFIAVDRGMLIKCGEEVLVSTRQAARGPELETLKRTVEKKYKVLDERERQARTATDKLEAGLVRRFMELDTHGRI